jgi:hypothetical protein
MNAETFAEWLRRQGYRVIRTPSSYWYEASPRVYQAFPYHWTLEPTEGELRGFLLKHNAVALRYSAPLTSSRGKVSYHVVCEDRSYDLAGLRRQARQNVRRGLRYAKVEPIPMSRLATEGWALRQDSLERQGRESAETEAWWRRLCESAANLPGFQAWGAIHDGELVASFLSFMCDDCFTLPHEQSASAHLQYRINNAIFFAVTQEAFQDPAVREVFFCLQSLDAPESVDRFKFHMGFTPKAVRQRVVFHPALVPFFNRASYGLLKRRLERDSDSATLSKVEGMVRFYLDGKCPPREQEWPECLDSCKSELLEEMAIAPA